MKFPFFFLLFLFSAPLFAQDSLSSYAQNQDSTHLLVPKNTIHWEVGGNNRFLGSTHYTRITHQFNENRYLGYGVGVFFAPYSEGLVSIGGEHGFQLFEGIDWKRYNFTVSSYGFYLSRIKHSNTFVELSVGYAFQYYYGSYGETLAVGTRTTFIIPHALRTIAHQFALGIGIRRQTRKGLFVRFYLTNYYELYRRRLESPLNPTTNIISPTNKQIANFGIGFGIGKSFGK